MMPTADISFSKLLQRSKASCESSITEPIHLGLETVRALDQD